MSSATPGPERTLDIHRLGRIDYASALGLQERLLEARLAGQIADTVLLLEHDPVVTLGRGAKQAHLLASREVLRAQGVAFFETGRGGDVTYHGPGQLVAYPILDLNPDRRDVRRYVKNLEEVMIRIAAQHGLVGRRVEGLNGAWVGERKIGAVGVRIRRWVTMHGFALNVSTDLSAYDLIVPCGIKDKEVTSLERETGARVSMDEVMAQAGNQLAQVFEARVRWHDGRPELP